MVMQPRGVCAGCPFSDRCHENRMRVIDLGLQDRTDCTFYQGHSTQLQTTGGSRNDTWSIVRAGYPPRLLEDLRIDARRVRTDLPEAKRHVPELMVEYVERVIATVGSTQMVVVRAFATEDGRWFSADIQIGQA